MGRECVGASTPVEHTTVWNKSDWMGFSPGMGESGGRGEGPTVTLFPAGLAPQRCAWELASRLGDSAVLGVADLFLTSLRAVVRGGA